MTLTMTFALSLGSDHLFLCLLRCKSYSTSFSWRAFQHLTANVKAFSSLLKYNPKMSSSEEEFQLLNEVDAAKKP